MRTKPKFKIGSIVKWGLGETTFHGRVLSVNYNFVEVLPLYGTAVKASIFVPIKEAQVDTAYLSPVDQKVVDTVKEIMNEKEEENPVRSTEVSAGERSSVQTAYGDTDDFEDGENSSS